MSDASRDPIPMPSPDDRGGASVTLAEVSLALAWNVRGDPAQASFVAEAERVLGLPLPLQPSTSSRSADATLLWLGPRSWLLVAATGFARDGFDATRKLLNAAGGALFDVSASYVAWSVSGEAASRVLNRTCPLDLHPRAFPAGKCAQSVLGHVGALLYRPGGQSTFVVLAARSLGADAWTALCAAAECERLRIGPATSFGAAPQQ